MLIKVIKMGALLTALASVLGGCAFNINEASSVAVIGGADGPTAVFLSSNFGIFPIIAAIVAVAVVIAAVFAAVVAGRNKRQ